MKNSTMRAGSIRAELAGLRTTEGLAEIVAAAIERLGPAGLTACLAIAPERGHIIRHRPTA